METIVKITGSILLALFMAGCDVFSDTELLPSQGRRDTGNTDNQVTDNINVSVKVNIGNVRKGKNTRKGKSGPKVGKGMAGRRIAPSVRAKTPGAGKTAGSGQEASAKKDVAEQRKRLPADQEAPTDAGAGKTAESGQEVSAGKDVGEQRKRLPADQEAPTDAGAGKTAGSGQEASAEKDAALEQEKCLPGEQETPTAAEDKSKVNILFYLGHKDDGSCWNYLSQSIDEVDFYPHIESFSWQSGVAFYSHNPKFYQFRKTLSQNLGLGGGWTGWNAEPVYVLKKGLFPKDKNDEYLKHTIQTEYVRNIQDHYEVGRGARKWDGEPQFPWPHQPRNIPEDPLFGLHKFLIDNPYGFVRPQSKTLVVFLEFDNYYYTSKEWQDFVKGHKDTWFVALSSRRGMVANHSFPSYEKLHWIPCGDLKIAVKLADFIKKME